MITKEQWSEIQHELTGDYGAVRFSFQMNETMHLISVIREHSSEGRRALFVFIDKSLDADFARESHPLSPLTRLFWAKRSAPCYTSAARARIEKDLGKRFSKKAFPNLNKRFTYYFPSFNRAASVVQQYKKIAGLKLVCMGAAVYER